MTDQGVLTGKALRTPKAAALAGIVFSVLLIASELLIWLSVPVNPSTPAIDVMNKSETISLALNILPLAGIAFLWFIATVRNRLGAQEDQFFSTVFFGSGLLYLTLSFTAASLAGGLVRVLRAAPELVRTGGYALARAEVYVAMNTYGIKMAGVFMFSTSTVLFKTQIVRRWIALLGFALAIALLLSVGTIDWIPVVVPLWVLLVSIDILIHDLSGKSAEGKSSGGIAQLAPPDRNRHSA
jgi:hypothetical protein